MRMGPRGAVALVALVIAACAPGPPVAPAPGGVSATPTAEPSPTVAVAPTAPRPSASPIPTPLAVPQLDGLIRSLTTSWRPTGEAVAVQMPGGIDGSLIMAVGLDGSPGVPLLAFGPSEGWDIRRDGSAVAVSLLTGPSSARIAVWESASGRARWVSPSEAGALHRSPVWSPDGATIYYSALRPPDDLGIFRVGASGGPVARVRAPEGNGAELIGFTPDGRGLVWSRIQAGGSSDILDLGTGRDRSFDPTTTSFVASWREQRPRALVISGACCAVRGKGTLSLWDDLEGEVRPIFGSELAANDGVTGAAWSPDGKRIVAIVHDLALPSFETAGPLVVMNEQGSDRSSLAATDGAIDVSWVTSGILFRRGSADGMSAELLLVAPGGGSPRPIFSGAYVGRWEVVAR